MELIDRYLQAVGFWLPKAQRDDIIAELAEDIRSQIEDKETELRRKLDAAELEGLLRRCGQPLLVAQRYLPQQQLIGPVLFPIYRFVLKICAWGFFVPWLLVWLGFVIFSPAYRAHDPIHKLGEMALTVLYPAFFFGTLSFAFFEKSIVKSLLERNWDPRKLPPVHDPNRIPRSSSIFDLTANLVFLIWWMSVMWFRTVFELGGATIRLAPEWQYYVCGYLLITLAMIALSWANLFRPYWTRLRASVRLACNCLGSALFCWLLKSAIVAEIILPNASPAQSLAVTNAINMWAARIFPAAVVFCLVIVVVDIRRILRVKTTVGKTAGCVVALVLLTLMATGASAQMPTGRSARSVGCAASVLQGQR
jgi:hypothetical protein